MFMSVCNRKENPECQTTGQTVLTEDLRGFFSVPSDKCHISLTSLWTTIVHFQFLSTSSFISLSLLYGTVILPERLTLRRLMSYIYIWSTHS